MSPDEVVARISELDVCTVSDALDRLGLPGALPGINPTWEGARASGRVVTMSVGPAEGRSAKHHLGARAIELAGAGDIIVVARTDASATAVSAWGGLLTVAAQRRSVGGVLVDGACRDIDEIRTARFPVFARAASPLTARKRVSEHSVGEPVRIGGVFVETGYYVVADGSGVAFFSPTDAPRVLEAAARIVDREKLMTRDLEAGASATTVLGTNYEEMLSE